MRLGANGRHGLGRAANPRAPHARLRITALGLAAVLLLGGCLGAGDAGAGDGPTLPTPQSSLSGQIEGTLATLRDHLAATGFRIDPPISPYRPSEPADLVDIPRAVFQTSIPDASQGYVVIYEFSSPGLATTDGLEFAIYLGGGFGQTNFPVDAQFSLRQLAGTLIFTWWSRALATDKVAAEAAFNVIRGVGQEIPVTK